jgi:MFS family permease
MFIEQINSLISSIIKNSLYFVDYQKTKIKDLIFSLKGNARAMLITEPNWTIPIAWFGIYSPIYMLALGVSKLEIGLITSLAIAVQAIGTVLGGVFADKWGHKKTLIIFDSISWPVSMIIFAFAQDIWWFVVGVVINNLCYIVLPAWHCLFIEGVSKDKRANIYAVLQIALNGASLFVPIAGVIVDGLGLVTGCRIMYGMASISMILGIVYRGIKTKDTKVSEEVIKNKKSYSFKDELIKFKEAFLSIKNREELFWFSIVQILVAFALIMWNTYYPVFLTDPKGVGLTESAISIFPFIFSVVMISIIVIFIPQIKEKDFKKYLLIGTSLSIVSAFLYVFTPLYKMSFIALASILNGIWMAFFRPLSDAYSMNILTDTERARILSVFNTLIIIAVIPAAPLAGKLYTIYPRLTFIAVGIILIITLLIIKFKFSYGEEGDKKSN